MIKHFDPNTLEDTVAASVGKDLGEIAEVEGHLAELLTQQAELAADTPAPERAALELEIARAMQFVKRGEEAWRIARAAVDVFLVAEDWEKAADACEVLYLSDQPGSLSALGQGVWLSVTYPINPEITIQLLGHVIDDTPDDSDGAAVAAATASYIADIRTEEGPQREQLQFFTQQMLGKVARRHSEVNDQQQFAFWIEKLELDMPEKFLVRLRNIVDVLVQDDWWFDRDELRSRIQDH